MNCIMKVFLRNILKQNGIKIYHMFFGTFGNKKTTTMKHIQWENF